MNSSRPARPAIFTGLSSSTVRVVSRIPCSEGRSERALHLKMGPGLTGDPLRVFSQGILDILSSDRQPGKYSGLVIGEDQSQGSLNRRSAFPIQPIRTELGRHLRKMNSPFFYFQGGIRPLNLQGTRQPVNLNPAVLPIGP